MPTSMRLIATLPLALAVLVLALGTACTSTRKGKRMGDEPDVARAKEGVPATPKAQVQTQKPSPPRAGPDRSQPTAPQAADGAAFAKKKIVIPKGAAITENAAAERSPLRGQAVPKFSLPNQDGVTFNVEDYAGQWVVMYFYPENDTPGCTCQATEFTEIVKEYAKRDAPVVGISPDSRTSHQNFINKYGLKLTLLSDPALDVARDFGATRTWKLSSGILETVVRSTLLIDPDGVIAWHWPEVVPEGHAQRVLKKLVELRGS